MIKEVIGKTEIKKNILPKKIIFEGNDVYDRGIIADKFNKFFVNVGHNLASKIVQSNHSFKSYLTPTSETLNENNLSDAELQNAFFSLQPNKSPGLDDISVNVVKSVFSIIKSSLHYIFDQSLKLGVFPNKLKFARILPAFKDGEDTELSNYRPISILPCFSKILERIMYNRLYTFLCKHNILYKKQFGFQAGHSTDHAIIHLVNEILQSFNENKYTLGVFIDLSKAFDTVDHTILLDKLENYGVKHTNLKWFRSYLSSRKQVICYEGNKTNYENIICGVPQGSILGPLLFLIYINDLHTSSKVLNSILFADDTNLFYSHQNINTLFETVNKELLHLNEWLKANKLSLNTTKTKYTFFHKLSVADDIPLKLPNLYINKTQINRERKMKFLGVILDETLTWKSHIDLIQSKVAKSLGILYKAKFLLNQKRLKNIYFSFIHSYLNYANIAWASIHYTKLKKLHNQQKHASRIIYNEDRMTSAQPLLNKLRALNIYQINIYQTLLFMYKIRNNLAPNILKSNFQHINHKYPTRHSAHNFQQPKTISKRTSFSISNRGPFLWNNILEDHEKTILQFSVFKHKSKRKSFLLRMKSHIFNFQVYITIYA